MRQPYAVEIKTAKQDPFESGITIHGYLDIKTGTHNHNELKRLIHDFAESVAELKDAGVDIISVGTIGR